MFWIVVAIIVIVVIVHNNNKKKKNQSGQQGQGTQVHTQTPPRTQAPKAQPQKSSTPPKAGDPIDQAAFARAMSKMGGTGGQAGQGKKPSAPPKAGDPIDQAAFAQAFAQMGVTGGQGGQAGKTGTSKAEAPKAQEKKSSPPPKAGDPIDQAAFARAFAQMGVTGGQGGQGAKSETFQAEPPKAAPKAPEPARPEPPKPQAKAGGDDRYDRFIKRVLGYYQQLWNKENGSLYTELDSMPIHHFGFQCREDRLVESVWLAGDEIPLVNETPYAKLCAGDDCAQVIPLDSQQMTTLYGLVRDFLIYLGTVEQRGDYFYPLKPGQAPAGQSAPAQEAAPAKQGPAGKAEQGFSQADKDAQLRSQVQALLEKQKKDKPPKK